MTTADTLFALIYRGKCPECHRRLYRKDGYTPAARFCSDACRAKRWRRRRRREKWKAAGDRLCGTCGTPSNSMSANAVMRGSARTPVDRRPTASERRLSASIPTANSRRRGARASEPATALLKRINETLAKGRELVKAAQLLTPPLDLDQGSLSVCTSLQPGRAYGKPGPRHRLKNQQIQGLDYL